MLGGTLDAVLPSMPVMSRPGFRVVPPPQTTPSSMRNLVVAPTQYDRIESQSSYDHPVRIDELERELILEPLRITVNHTRHEGVVTDTLVSRLACRLSFVA